MRAVRFLVALTSLAIFHQIASAQEPAPVAPSAAASVPSKSETAPPSSSPKKVDASTAAPGQSAAALSANATPAELMKAMETALSIQPADQSPAGRKKALLDALERILAGAERVLAHPASTPMQKAEALQFKISAYYQAARMRQSGAADKLTALAKSFRAERPGDELAAMATYLSIKARHDTYEGLSPKALPEVEEFLTQFPGDEAAIGLLEEIGLVAELGGDASSAAKAYGLILERFADHRMARLAQGHVRRIQSIGQPVAWSGVLASGEPLAAELLKGKIVVIDFWATWCGPCIGELPHLKQLYQKYHDQGLEIVGIPLDEDYGVLDQFLKTERLPWLQLLASAPAKTAGNPPVLPPHPIADQYGIVAIPQMMLIDRQGKVLATNLRGDRLDDRLREIFATPKKNEKEEKK